MTVALKTGRYHDHRPAHGVAIATSLGRPKWPLPYEIAAAIRDLMPFGLLGLPEDEFGLRYLDRLDRLGADRLRAQFEKIAQDHPGQPLVLLCWENVLAGDMCHRRIAADWLEAHGFGAVPECQPDPPAQTALIPHPVNDAADYLDREPPKYVSEEDAGPIQLRPLSERDRLMADLYDNHPPEASGEPAHNADKPASGQLRLAPQEDR